MRLPNSAGISPLNWFPARLSNVKLVRLPNSAGISPLNWFPARLQQCQVGEVAQLRRYLPAQLVPGEEAHEVKLVRLPNSAGISPLNWFPSRSSTSRLERLPNAAGISPLSRFSSRSNSTTRPSESVTTPCHLPSGTSLNQLVLCPSSFRRPWLRRGQPELPDPFRPRLESAHELESR